MTFATTHSLRARKNLSAALRVLALMSAVFMCEPASANPVNITLENEAPEALLEAIQEALPEAVQAETPLHARRQGRRASEVVKETLNAFGYYDPAIDITVEDTAGTPRAVLYVDTGPLFRIESLLLKFTDPKPRTQDIDKLQSELPLSKGDAAIPANIIDAERILGSSLRRMGYAFSDVEERDVIGDRDAATLSIRYNIVSGPRVRIGEVVYPKNIRTKQTYLARLDPTAPGDLYDPAKLALYNSRLSETRLYSTAIAQLSSEPVSLSPEGDAVHDIVLNIKERPRNTIALGANYGTNEGLGVNAELTRRNLTRRGDLLIADTRIAQRERGLNLTWRRPNQLGYGKGLVLTSAILDADTDAFDQQIFKLGAGFEVIKSQKLNYTYGVRSQYIRQTENRITQDFQTVSAYAGFHLDNSDSLLDPRQGWRAEGRIVPTYAFGETSDKSYVRSVTQGRAYLPLDARARLIVAGRLRIGALFGADASEVPGDDRFYAGGGGSVRGFGFQAIGPLDMAGKPIGGRSLLDSSVEARWRVRDSMGVVGFVDAGNVSDSLYPEFDNLKIGAGLGLRYMTPAGPLRLDVATPLNPADQDESFQIYLSIGQAF